MVAEIEINFDDIMALQRDALRTFKFHHRNKILISILGFCIGFVFSSFTADRSIIHSIILALIVCLCSPILYKLMALRKYKSDLKKGDSDITGDYKLTISPEEIHIERGNIFKQHKWDEIVKVTSDEYRYFLYTNQLKAVLLTKFPSNLDQNEMDEFNAFIKKRIQHFGLDNKMRV